jgi:hypothetical protein
MVVPVKVFTKICIADENVWPSSSCRVSGTGAEMATGVSSITKIGWH